VVPPDVFEATFLAAMSTSNGDTACDIVTIIDDDVLEGEHSFEILITATDPQLVNIDPSNALVNIKDNEGMITKAGTLFLCCACVYIFFLFCGLRLFYAQSHSGDSRVHATIPCSALALNQGHLTMSCICLVVLGIHICIIPPMSHA